MGMSEYDRILLIELIAFPLIGFLIGYFVMVAWAYWG